MLVYALDLIGRRNFDVQNGFTFTTEYYRWLHEFFTDVEIADDNVGGPMADPDGDGVFNLAEFTFNMQSREPDVDGFPHVDELNGFVRIIYRQPTGDWAHSSLIVLLSRSPSL